MKKTGNKFLLTVVLLAGAFALSFGAYTMRQNIMSPFQFSRISEADKELILPSASDTNDEDRTSDTDNDGLPDWEEINLYATSPFLPDSDSDGLTDSAEVRQGTDPNCAIGEDCRGIKLVTPDTRISDLFPQFSDSNVTLKDKTVQEFKNILIAQGADEATLARIDDDTLLIILEESLRLEESDVNATSTNDFELDLDEVRLFLIDLGVPREEVFNMSNSELESILRTFR